MDELGVERRGRKPAIGWIGEKVGRLKPNGQLRGYSPLSRVSSSNCSPSGSPASSASGTLLEELVGDRSEADFAGLVARAEQQREVAEDLQLRAARLL